MVFRGSNGEEAKEQSVSEKREVVLCFVDYSLDYHKMGLVELEDGGVITTRVEDGKKVILRLVGEVIEEEVIEDVPQEACCELCGKPRRLCTCGEFEMKPPLESQGFWRNPF